MCERSISDNDENMAQCVSYTGSETDGLAVAIGAVRVSNDTVRVNVPAMPHRFNFVRITGLARYYV
jgi:hypothetical protein